jgi:molecular chaperone HtpG
MDKCKELLPDYLRFVKGLVDSSDLSLNISREMLQKSRELKEIAENVEKKIVSKLESLLKNDFDTYLKFFKSFGVNLKFGVYDDFGAKKELLKDLIIYNTINQDKMITLKEYVSNMKEDQKVIYYASSKTKEAVLAMPQMDVIKKHGYDVLILPDDVDEFLLQVLMEYDGHKFQSINQGDLDLLDKDEEEKIKKLNEEKKPMLDAIKEALKDEVNDVVISKRLTDSAVCLVSGDGVSFEMEKVLASMPNSNPDIKANRILELNPNHDLFKALENVYLKDQNELKEYADLLYSQALLVEGFPLKDPIAFSKKMCELIIKASK